MPVTMIRRLVRQLSGGGALDNVRQVLATRASVDEEIAAFTARVAPVVAPIAADTPAAA
jgi:hypothetical protein